MSCRAASLLLTGFILCFSSWWVCSAEASVSCYAKNHADHTTYYLNESVPESQEYSWSVNGVVVAHEGHFLNKTLVLEQGPQNMSLKACHEDVKYWNGRTGEVISCTRECPAKRTPEDPTTAAVPVVILAAVVGAVLLTVIIIITYCNWEKLKQHVQVKTEVICENYYPASPTDTEAIIKENKNVVY